MNIVSPLLLAASLLSASNVRWADQEGGQLEESRTYQVTSPSANMEIDDEAALDELLSRSDINFEDVALGRTSPTPSPPRPILVDRQLEHDDGLTIWERERRDAMEFDAAGERRDNFEYFDLGASQDRNPTYELMLDSDGEGAPLSASPEHWYPPGVTSSDEERPVELYYSDREEGMRRYNDLINASSTLESGWSIDDEAIIVARNRPKEFGMWRKLVTYNPEIAFTTQHMETSCSSALTSAVPLLLTTISLTALLLL